MTAIQSEALSLMSTFKDVVMTDVVSAPHDDEIRDVTAAHIVNHVLRHRTKVGGMITTIDYSIITCAVAGTSCHSHHIF